MERINNLEELVQLFMRVAARVGKAIGTTKQSYRVLPYKTSGMLNWNKPVEIQTLPIPPFARIGAIGDGNCMLHSILFCLSPTYRTLDYDGRQFIADVWRQVLLARIDHLKGQADILYEEIGGWGALEESFDRLPTPEHTTRRELDIEMAPLITRLYGHNCLAIQIHPDSLILAPVELTFRKFDARMPTVLINYLGGSTNAGAAGASSFFTSGHYEPVISAVFSRKATTSSSEVRHRTTLALESAAVAAAKAAKKKVPRVTLRRLKGPLYTLDDTHTQYTVSGDDFEPILDMFRAAAAASAAYIN
jgi:hypothetical protein